ncbi:hypothetical protein Glove_9g379 [Diversispora epigaea]|uniref:Uncharacterized protein n=1 Tax=Diversispora epigaea TaxID=1348612 RepID=A0A397JV22_9GLOM|nr:hypothetical protein Glove_9g379 [Diversispora epigaea]
MTRCHPITEKTVMEIQRNHQLLTTNDLLISDIVENTHLSNGQLSSFPLQENTEGSFLPLILNKDCPSTDNKKEKVYKELETFANTLSSPELFTLYNIDLQYVEPPVQATPFEIFNKFSSFLHQYDMAIYKVLSIYKTKLITLKISKEQLDLSATFLILQQKYMESKPPLNSYLEEYHYNKGKHSVDNTNKSQMKDITYDTLTMQQSSQSKDLDLFKNNIPSYPCVEKSIIEEDTLTQQLK